ncbi:hypothetical protein ACFL2K_03725 [Candidatus Margulisiibacteriota bacterium]
MKKVFISLVLSMALLFLFACTNAFQNLEKSYQEGRYLAAAQHAIKGMRDKELRPQVQSFMTTHGDNILEKAMFKGERLVETRNDELPIQYFDSFIKVLEEMILLEFEVKDIKKYLKKAEKQFDLAVEKFVSKEYKKGRSAYKKKLFRKAAYYFKKVLKYDSNYKDTDKYFARSEKNARRIISIAPFYKPVKILGVIDLITRGGSDSIVKERLTVENVNVIEAFNSKLLFVLNKKKSKYLTFLMSNRDDLDNTQYYIDGIIHDFDVFSERFTTVDSNDKKHLNIKYRVVMKIKVAVTLSSTDQQVREFNYQSSAEKTFTFKGKKEEGYIAKHLVVQEAVDKAAYYLRNEILQLIDKDLDPYMTMVVY